MQTAKIFMNGQSQAIRLPKEFRFKGKEVYVKKSGNIVLLIPMEGAWDSFLEGIFSFSSDCFSEPRDQLKFEKREEIE